MRTTTARFVWTCAILLFAGIARDMPAGGQAGRKKGEPAAKVPAAKEKCHLFILAGQSREDKDPQGENP